MSEATQNTTSKKDMIAKAINAAKAKMAAKAAAEASEPSTEAKSEKKNHLADSKAARAAKQEKIKADREARKAAKAAAKAADQVEVKPTSHMKKVLKAASKLPPLNSTASQQVDDIVTLFSRDQINAIALHLQHQCRVKATLAAVETKLELDQPVRIVGGDPKFVGLEGTISEVRRIRCYVDVPGHDKPVYCFTSDVEVLADEPDEADTETLEAAPAAEEPVEPAIIEDDTDVEREAIQAEGA